MSSISFQVQKKLKLSKALQLKVLTNNGLIDNQGQIINP